LAEARVDADAILAATEKAMESDAWLELSEEERAAVKRASNELRVAYHAEDHLLVRTHIEKLDAATRSLAEQMMDSAVKEALRGKKLSEV
jgi:molecular chaperone HscA